jgi:hypothetical protein
MQFSVDQGAREKRLIDRLVLHDRTKAEYLGSLHELVALRGERLVEATDQLRRQKPKHTFSLVDFVYFSLVTVATVGYGDIVPNSTPARLIVALQILYGVCLVVATSRRPGRAASRGAGHSPSHWLGRRDYRASLPL